MKKHVFAAALILIGSIWSGSPSHSAGNGTDPGHISGVMAEVPVKATVLFFNDIHGYLESFTITQDGQKTEVGGIARLAALVREIKAENRKLGIPTFLLLAGDILQGTPMSTVFRGQPDIECFNAMGVDAMTVGNHEFDFGVENFLELKRKARFPFLSANVILKSSGGRLCDAYTRLHVNALVSLYVAGVTTPELLTTTRPSNVSDLDVLQPAIALEPIMEQFRSKGPILLLSHCKAETDENTARKYPDLTAIIGGHDQILLNPRKKVGEVPIFQAFEKGRYLGRIDLWIYPSGPRAEVIRWKYYPIKADQIPDPEIAGIVDRYHRQLDSKYKEVIGTAEMVLDGERERIRFEETNLGNFVTDIMRDVTGAQIALLNSGSLRASINAGPVTVENVFQAMPYANELMMVDITGAELEAILKRAGRGSRQDEDGGFLQVSGIRFKIDGTTPVDIRVGEEPVDPETVYRTVITDFMAEGGDGYTQFVGKPAVSTRSPLRELIVSAIRSRGNVSAYIEDRILRSTSH
ncbi:bifunctional metallophosphatase/5'-nucleotidase [bacterium]|nr:bifunctional metallophosphatase/5'-nucleotidase [candidate division CSSED10-310 bacterium]